MSSRLPSSPQVPSLDPQSSILNPQSSPHSLTDAVEYFVPALRAASTGQPLRLSGLKGAARAFFLSRCFLQTPTPTLCVLPSDAEAEAFADDVRFFLGGSLDLGKYVYLYPVWDAPVAEGLSPSSDVLAEQIEGLYGLLAVATPLVVTSVEALMQRVLPQEALIAATLMIKRGQELALADLVDHLIHWGYRRVPLVEEKGEVSVRGGLLDLFPPLATHPLRIELDGDMVASIRTFDPSSQRSLALQEESILLPMRFFSQAHIQAARRSIEEALGETDMQHREKQRIAENLKSGLSFPGIEALLPYFYPALESLHDYLPPRTVVWLADPPVAGHALEECWQRLSTRFATASAAGHFVPAPAQMYCGPEQIWSALNSGVIVELEGLESRPGTGTPDFPSPLRGEGQSLPRTRSGGEGVLLGTPPPLSNSLPQGERGQNPPISPSEPFFISTALHLGLQPKGRERSLAPLVERIRQWQEQAARVFLIVSSAVQATHLQNLLLGHDLSVAEVSASPDLWQTRGDRLVASPGVVVGALSQGFSCPADGLVFVAEEEIFGERRHQRRTRPKPVADYLTGLSQLTVGDFIVHIDHGIGQYQGLRHLSVAGTAGDYLHLEYAGADRLYLPVERINLVQKYTGAEGHAPALDRLGGQSWEKVKRKTRETILLMARELLEIHALRETTERPPLASFDGDYEEFVARFPFEETSGQRAAIEDVLADLQSDKPMDRLVCGDVGYGKTEVALRAAFLTVQSGRQVAVLVPTTVLAQQHIETFTRRFTDYPVRIELLSRLRSPQENKTVVQGLAAGTVDIVIGTHRLLQRDIVFKNLGLIVIDEEHRFGVAHKEKIKKLRHLVDVLTLSATPIPRTLNMGLMGLRDLSVIETPPLDRQAIRTYVARFDDGLIRAAILQELERSGQVFFVHNRVETIERMAKQLRELVPEAQLAVAHGQMAEHGLEEVMLDFLHHRCNVLLCSTIIESGLDIPTANTIIINRADQLGLAQLYQLRGRVGRSAQRAYAYLLIPGEHLLTPDAKRRLEVLQELDELGSGFRLAAHDLEIRGAGNLLGKEQSGQVAAVGFELYAQMLEETVQELRGGKIRVQIEPEIQLGLPAYLPEAYIPDVNQRLVFYKKLANIEDRADLEDLATEMEDRFGPLPELVRVFFEVMDLRRVLREYLVTAVSRRGEKVTLHFHPDSPIKAERLVQWVHKERTRAQLTPDLRLTWTLKPAEAVIPAVQTLLQTLSESW